MKTEQALGDAAAKGSGVTLAAQAIRLLLHFASIVVLARLLDAADFGLLAMVVAIVGVSEVLRDLGLSMAAVQAPHLSRPQKTNLFWINAAAGLTFSLIVFALAQPISVLFGVATLVGITQWISVVYLFNGLSAQFRAEINRDLGFGRLAAVDIVPQAAGLAVAIVLAAAGYGFWALVAQMLVYSGGGLIMSVVLARWVPGLPRRRAGMRPLVMFGLSLTGTQAIGYAVRSVDTIALGIAYTPTATGLYNRAYQLVAAPFSQIAAPLTRVAVPVLSRVWSRHPDRFEDYLFHAQLIACYAIGPLYLAIAGLAPSVIAIALGPGWTPAVPILQALCIGGVFRALTQISYWAYLARGEAAKQLRVYAWFQPVIVVSVLAGLPWGPVGVAVGSSVGLMVYWIISLVAVGVNLQIDGVGLLRRAVSSILVAGLPVGTLCWLAQVLLPDPMLAVPAAAVLTLGYFAGLAAVSGKARRDMSVLIRFVRKAVTR